MTKMILSLAAASARRLPASVKLALYRIRPLAGLIRRGLNRAAPKGLVPVTVAAGGLEGMHLQLDLQSEKDYWLGTYEPELQAALLELVRPGMVVFDVGANIGYISLLCLKSMRGTGRVFAFEALPANLERLRANLELNGLADQVEIVAGAVIDRSQPVRFLVGPSGGMGKAEGSAGRQGIDYADTITMEGLSLDEFVYSAGNPAPQVVKLDIEGGEVLALPGMLRLLNEARPVVLLELHGPEAAHVAWTALVKAGYQICRMAPGFPGVPSLEALDWKAYLVGLPGAGVD